MIDTFPIPYSPEDIAFLMLAIYPNNQCDVLSHCFFCFIAKDILSSTGFCQEFVGSTTKCQDPQETLKLFVNVNQMSSALKFEGRFWAHIIGLKIVKASRHSKLLCSRATCTK